MLRLRGSEIDKNLQSRWTMKYMSRSNMDTAVWIVIPKCKLIPSSITVAFIVLGKWTWKLGSKLGLMQMLTDEWMDRWKTGSLYCAMLKAGVTTTKSRITVLRALSSVKFDILPTSSRNSHKCSTEWSNWRSIHFTVNWNKGKMTY